MKITPDVEKAFKIALNARSHSHSPYSRFAVGAALKVKGNPQAIGGCNVENASFGATICAERVAMHAAVAQAGEIEPEFIVVVTQAEEITVPCALCLQSMAEFCSDDFMVYLGNEKQILRSHRLKELLPYPFRAFTADDK